MIQQSEKRDKPNEAVLICKLHSERMQIAWQKIQTHFPLDKNKYIQLKPEEISFFDQLIFHFSKLQDGMGEKLFPAILENLSEEIKGLPFIDRLGKLEELEIITSAEDWLLLRETRNIVDRKSVV